MYLGKAELVSKSNSKILHSVSKEFPLPTVVRLGKYVHLPYKDILLTRKNILRRDKHKCAYCGRGDLPLTVDHILPKARGGGDTWDNLVAACLPCNNRKGDRTPAEANIKLLVKPYHPSFIMFLANSVSRLDDTWKPFLYQT